MEQPTFEQRKKALKEFIYLPLLYLIPDEIAVKRNLHTFTRDPYLAATDPYWQGVYRSKQFQVMLVDTWGWMMWQSLGIRGGVDNYSINYPFTRMTFALPMWAWLLAEMGINTDMFAAYPHGEAITFLTMEQAASNCDEFAMWFWNHPDLKMREVYGIVKAHRAHADYSGRNSHVKMDFRRDYYHTRANTKMVPLMEESEEAAYTPYSPNGFAEVETRMWFDCFLERLDDKDKQIVKLLEEGYTQQEIGEELGYANHSGVTKRIQFIKREFNQFRREDRRD